MVLEEEAVHFEFMVPRGLPSSINELIQVEQDAHCKIEYRLYVRMEEDEMVCDEKIIHVQQKYSYPFPLLPKHVDGSKSIRRFYVWKKGTCHAELRMPETFLLPGSLAILDCKIFLEAKIASKRIQLAFVRKVQFKGKVQWNYELPIITQYYPGTFMLNRKWFYRNCRVTTV